jgi:hypothetical protein
MAEVLSLEAFACSVVTERNRKARRRNLFFIVASVKYLSSRR